MKSYRTINEKRRAFSIIELITVMGIIAILIGLLVPALSKVHDAAKNVQQKAQFHSIEVALQITDMDKGDGGLGGYPESNNNFAAPQHLDDNTPYCGANKLAEAMVGQDFLGFHSDSDYRSDGTNEVLLKTGVPGKVTVYSAAAPTPNWQTVQENINSRIGPLIDLETANAFVMEDIWLNTKITADGFNDGALSEFPSLVLCDVFAETRSSGKKTGMPILYYKARTQFREQDFDDGVNGILDDIYYYPDNEGILDLGLPNGLGAFGPQPLADGVTDEAEFEQLILNTQITKVNPNVKRPYNEDTFILLSAGNDGLYGTADDIVNFKKEQ